MVVADVEPLFFLQLVGLPQLPLLALVSMAEGSLQVLHNGGVEGQDSSGVHLHVSDLSPPGVFPGGEPTCQQEGVVDQQAEAEWQKDYVQH